MHLFSPVVLGERSVNRTILKDARLGSRTFDAVAFCTSNLFLATSFISDPEKAWLGARRFAGFAGNGLALISF